MATDCESLPRQQATLEIVGRGRDGAWAVAITGSKQGFAWVTANLLTTAEAAGRLGCSAENVQRLVRAGQLRPAAQAGRAFLFWSDDVAALPPRKRGWKKGVPRGGAKKKRPLDSRAKRR